MLGSDREDPGAVCFSGSKARVSPSHNRLHKRCPAVYLDDVRGIEPRESQNFRAKGFPHLRDSLPAHAQGVDNLPSSNINGERCRGVCTKTTCATDG